MTNTFMWVINHRQREKNIRIIYRNTILCWWIEMYHNFFHASMDAWIKIWKNIIISIFCSFLSCSAIEVVPLLFFPDWNPPLLFISLRHEKVLSINIFLMTKIFFCDFFKKLILLNFLFIFKGIYIDALIMLGLMFICWGFLEQI